MDVGSNGNRESIPDKLEQYNDSVSQSSIGNIIKSFVFNPHQNDNKTKGDSSIGTSEKSQVHLNLIELSVAILADLYLANAACPHQCTKHTTQAKGHYR